MAMGVGCWVLSVGYWVLGVGYRKRGMYVMYVCRVRRKEGANDFRFMLHSCSCIHSFRSCYKSWSW